MPDKPFPRFCTRCKSATVEPVEADYEFVQQHDGRETMIVVRRIPIPTCASCKRQVLDRSTLDQIKHETYVQLGLLTPGEIRSRREDLELTQQQVQEILGLGGNTLSRWETGHVYQSRALDRFLRVFFASKNAQQRLRLDDWTSSDALLNQGVRTDAPVAQVTTRRGREDSGLTLSRGQRFASLGRHSEPKQFSIPPKAWLVAAEGVN